MEYLSVLTGIISSPRQTIRSFPEKIQPLDWLVPLILLLLTVSISTWLTGPLTAEYSMNRQYEMIENNPNLTDDQKEEYLNNLDEQDPAKNLYLKVFAGTLVGLLLEVGVLMVIGSLVLGGSAAFLAVWHGVLWVSVIKILEIIVTVIITLTTGQVLVELGLTVLLPDSMTGSMLYYLLLQFGIFAVWRTILYGMVISTLYEVDQKKAWVTLFAAWFIFALISAVMITKSGLMIT
ncbi:MAG: DUF1542 domain-containing protein [FCB group bacterium]|nr:DUF1542 domain-containing protein [FCB group bacterium]